MLTWDGRKGAAPEGLTRRAFLRAGTLTAGAVGLALTEPALARAAAPAETRCILLFLVGGPSHLETFDPKPAAPAEVRGPFGTIPTALPGVRLGEHLPETARRLDRIALVRSVFHKAAPVHETGHQLLQTGNLFKPGQELPHVGAVVSQARGRAAAGAPAWAVVPGPIGNTGVSVSHGQAAGLLGAAHEPAYLQAGRNLDAEPARLRERYGRSAFGESCLLARQLVEAGTRLVTVNMFDSVFNEITWDCHADGGALATTLDDYRQTLCPMFDRAYSALLDDLQDRGLLENTLVVAMGEFGRTPYLNRRGGRDHWPDCWSILLAGGGVRGGQVIGATDKLGAEVVDRPVHAAEVTATIYHSLGIDVQAQVPGLLAAEPVREVFG